MKRLAASTLALLLTANLAWAADSASRLDDIARTGTIRVAHRLDSVPFSYVDENKKVTGFSIDVCTRVVDFIQRRLKLSALKIEWVPVTTETRFQAVADGKADLECGSSTVTLGRMEQVDFSNFTFLETTGLLVKRSAGIKEGSELAGKKIAVITGTTNEKVVRTATAESGIKAEIVPVKDRAEGMKLLESGGADALASDKLLLLGALLQSGQAFMVLPDDLSIEPYAIALPRGDWKLRLAVNAGLADMYRSRQVVEVFDKWFTRLGLQPGPLFSAMYLLGALAE